MKLQFIVKKYNIQDGGKKYILILEMEDDDGHPCVPKSIEFDDVEELDGYSFVYPICDVVGTKISKLAEILDLYCHKFPQGEENDKRIQEIIEKQKELLRNSKYRGYPDFKKCYEIFIKGEE